MTREGLLSSVKECVRQINRYYRMGDLWQVNNIARQLATWTRMLGAW